MREIDERFSPKNATDRWRGSVVPGKSDRACKRAERIMAKLGPQDPLVVAHLGHCEKCRARYKV